MGWLENLLFNSDSIAHIVLLYSVVISLGVLLGRIKIFGLLKLQARRSIYELSCSRRHPAEHRSDDHSMAMSFRQGRPAHDGRCPMRSRHQHSRSGSCKRSSQPDGLLRTSDRKRICLRLSFRCGRNHLCHYPYKASVQGQSVQGEGDAF